KNIVPTAEELAQLKRVGKGAEGYFPALALVGGAPAGAIVRNLLDDKDSHVRAAAAETCLHAIFNEATVAALAGKLGDPSREVRRAAIRALAANANWRSAAAQQALIELATQPGKAVDPNDRVSAVDALGQAVRFQVRGVRQDPALFRALVSLLDGKDEELRVMASNILAPIRDSDFRGDSGRPERKAPEGGWQPWLDGIAAKAAGYGKDYEVCSAGAHGAQPAVGLYCKGGTYLGKDPASAF